MGQKINTNLLRLNIKTSNWKSKYYTKTSEESTFYAFNDLEIKKYMNRIFNIYGIILKNSNLYYSHASLKIFVSFFLTKKFFKVCKKIKKVFYDKQFNFSEYFLESLNLFLKNNLSIYIIFDSLNKRCSVRIPNNKLQLIKKACFKFRRFNKKPFFIESINILMIALKKRNSSKLVAEFLSFQIKVLKKQNFFLIAIKQMLHTLLSVNTFSSKGIKISIRGRLNGAPRARTNTILLGNISAQTFKANINYNTATAFTRNGTFGIKVWIQECD